MRVYQGVVAAALLAALACDSPTGPLSEAIENELPWHLLSGRIAFVTEGCDEISCQGAIQLIDAASRTVRQLVDHIAISPPRRIEFSPGGSAVTISAFVHFPGPGAFDVDYQLYTIDLQQPALVPLRPDPEDSHAIWAWSSDGRLALVRTVRVDGGIRRAITIDDLVLSDVEGEPADLSRMTWSPDGSEIVVSMRRQLTTPHLYAISIPDGAVTALMPGAGDDTYAVAPAYAPDGVSIAYVESIGGNGEEMWLLDRLTGVRSRLTTGERDAAPAWSPDGTAILFIRNDQPHIIDMATRKVTRLARRNVTAVAWTE